MPKAYDVPATGSLPYQNFIVETGFTEDRWVTMAEARPGAPGVVHHIVVYILRGGSKSPVSADGSFSVLVGWAPGDLGLVCPPETALRVPKGAKLRIEMHYTPNGTAVSDREVDHGMLFHTYLQAVGVDTFQDFTIAGRKYPIADPAKGPIKELLA